MLNEPANPPWPTGNCASTKSILLMRGFRQSYAAGASGGSLALIYDLGCHATFQYPGIRQPWSLRPLLSVADVRRPNLERRMLVGCRRKRKAVRGTEPPFPSARGNGDVRYKRSWPSQPIDSTECVPRGLGARSAFGSQAVHSWHSEHAIGDGRLPSTGCHLGVDRKAGCLPSTAGRQISRDIARS